MKLLPLLSLALCAGAHAAVLIDGTYGQFHVNVAENENGTGEYVYTYSWPGWDVADLTAAGFTLTDGWFNMLNDDGDQMEGQIWNVSGAEQSYMGSASFTLTPQLGITIRFDSEHAPTNGLINSGLGYSYWEPCFGEIQGQTWTLTPAPVPSGWTIPEPSTVMSLLAVVPFIASRRRRLI